MRIAVVTQYFPTSAQPWAGHSAYQTLRLLARKHDLEVFYPESRYPRRFTPRTRTHGALDPSWQPAGVRAHYIPYTALPLISRAFNGSSIARELLPHVRAFRPDLILSYVIYPDGYAAVRIGQELGVPVVTTAIGSDLNRISGRLVAHHTRQALREATHTTTVSADLLVTARRLGADPARSTAIINGCDTTVFHPRDRRQARAVLQLAPETQAVVYVGRFDLRKGLAELIEATARLRAKRSQLHCYLVGDGSDKPALTELVAKHRAEDFVHFIPPCPTDRVALWMAAADLVTLPSYKEGCPNVVIEALASGRPVVATYVGGIPELMDNSSGRLIPTHDAAALAAGMDETLSTPWDAAELARQHGRSWQDVADDLEAVLRETQGQRQETRRMAS
ncbi:glycosyl transferase, group 1 family protein [Cystobacter fuscus DSM 2262]|uniref:Glycosyl transferase, group 1 family protein n=1 Tax=Cystobacter fuscus (strain ATCC 25194 / DSM 2262 / NBRC 100088 / M29) TaxID=1242864 RepID=S9PMS7_CYSF2|nr:glycosyltransferase [Cystobacter fuscus]EPX63772.1 glycosyl transferase, group 1 family protein [Cystobacter fuscus DSM 2262]